MDQPESWDDIPPPPSPVPPGGYTPVCGDDDVAGYYRIRRESAWTLYQYSTDPYQFSYNSWEVETLVREEATGKLKILWTGFGNAICSNPQYCGPSRPGIVQSVISEPRRGQVVTAGLNAFYNYTLTGVKVDYSDFVCYDEANNPRPIDIKWCRGAQEKIIISFNPDDLPHCGDGGDGKGDPDCCDCCSIAEKLLAKLKNHPLYTTTP